MTHHRASPRRHVLIVVVSIVIGCCLLGPAGPASAQQGWGSVSTLSVPSTTYPRSDRAVQVAANAAGDVIAVWGQGLQVLAVRASGADGRWTQEVALGITNAAGFAYSPPGVALDSAGNAFVAWTSVNGIEAARYSAAAGTWAAAVVVSPAIYPGEPGVATDAAGNALVVWGDSGRIKTARYSKTSETWSVPVDISDGYLPRLAMDAAGNAIVMSSRGNLPAGAVRAMRYSVASGTWLSVTELAAVNQLYNAPQISMDAAGNAVSAWMAYTTGPTPIVQTARFVAATGVWGAVVILGPASSYDAAVGASGHAVVAWTSPDGVAHASRYSPGSATWNAAKDISAAGAGAELRDIGVDANGHALAIWTASDRRVHAARNDAASDTWSNPAPISVAGLVVLHTQIAVHLSGDATLLWGASQPDCPPSCYGAVQSARWTPAPLAPTVTGGTAASGVFAVDFTAPPTSDPALAPTNYAYSLDGGATWTARTPASAASPLVMNGLTDFAPYTLQLRAINSGGAGLATAPLVVKAGNGTDAPTGFMVTAVAGNTVTMEWSPPEVGIMPAEYVFEGGVAPGEVLASISTASSVPRFTVAAPSGVFYLRVLGVAGRLRSAASNEIRLVVNVPAAPSAPANLLGLVNGASIALSWRNTLGGGAPTSLWLNVSGAATTTLPLPLGETFTFPDVPPGTYTMSVIAANANGASAPSNAVTLSFPGGCSGVPGALENFQAWTVGSTVFMSWGPPMSGPAASSFVVSVNGTYAGSAVVTERSLSSAAAPGSYTLSVAARNTCGTGPASPPQTVLIP